jgi:hypothetical protein
LIAPGTRVSSSANGSSSSNGSSSANGSGEGDWLALGPVGERFDESTLLQSREAATVVAAAPVPVDAPAEVPTVVVAGSVAIQRRERLDELLRTKLNSETGLDLMQRARRVVLFGSMNTGAEAIAMEVVGFQAEGAALPKPGRMAPLAHVNPGSAVKYLNSLYAADGILFHSLASLCGPIPRLEKLFKGEDQQLVAARALLDAWQGRDPAIEPYRPPNDGQVKAQTGVSKRTVRRARQIIAGAGLEFLPSGAVRMRGGGDEG